MFCFVLDILIKICFISQNFSIQNFTISPFRTLYFYEQKKTL